MEKASGKIVILVDNKPKLANRIQYGFVKVKGMEEDVFFNILTSFQNTEFEKLKIGDRVSITFKQTDYGPYAENLTLSNRRMKPKNLPSPSASL